MAYTPIEPINVGAQHIGQNLRVTREGPGRNDAHVLQGQLTGISHDRTGEPAVTIELFGWLSVSLDLDPELDVYLVTE